MFLPSYLSKKKKKKKPVIILRWGIFWVLNALLQVDLANYLYESLHSVAGVRVYGPAPSQTVFRAALCSFNVENIHPTDIATFLDQQVRGPTGDLHINSCLAFNMS